MLITTVIFMVALVQYTAALPTPGNLASKETTEASKQKRFLPPWLPPPVDDPQDGSGIVGFRLKIPPTKFDENRGTDFMRIGNFYEGIYHPGTFRNRVGIDRSGRLKINISGFYWLQILTQIYIYESEHNERVVVGYGIKNDFRGHIEDLLLYRMMPTVDDGPLTLEVSGFVELQAGQELEVIFARSSNVTILDVEGPMSTIGALMIPNKSLSMREDL